MKTTIKSLPPLTVHVKRKATDQPVEVLRLDDSKTKRQRLGTEYCFSRQIQPLSDNVPVGLRAAPEPSDSYDFNQDLEASKDAVLLSDFQENEIVSARSDSGIVDEDGPSYSVGTAKTGVEPMLVRQYRITKGPSSSQIVGNATHKRTTLLVERKSRPPRLSSSKESVADKEYSCRALNPLRPPSGQIFKKPGPSTRVESSDKGLQSAYIDLPQLKPTKNISLDSGAFMLWDITDEKLAAEIGAYSMQEMSKQQSVEHFTSSDFSAPARRSPLVVGVGVRRTNGSRFKPKAPVLRWHERNPEDAAVIAKAEKNAREDIEMQLQKDLQRQLDLQEDQQMQSDDDSEYVIDTYTRMPLAVLDTAQQRNAQEIGVLVLVDDSDVDNFYGEGDGNSEEEDLYDEEDENAENHYTADYPDEEMDSDDEFDRNPYQYARDRDEFDGEAWSDDDADAIKYPWSAAAKRSKRREARPGFAADSDEEVDSEEHYHDHGGIADTELHGEEAEIASLEKE